MADLTLVTNVTFTTLYWLPIQTLEDFDMDSTSKGNSS